jgi:microsomal epoxide hydrolase
MPLLISHGWPGSVLEFMELIPMLTDPARFGADPEDAFTVVAPSLPGFTLSFRPGQARMGVEEMADTLHALMTNVLGYTRFGTQGGDWGAFVTTRMAWQHPQDLLGLHLNFLALRRDLTSADCTTPEEHAYLGELQHFLREETGYQAIQGTRPQTLAFGLTDSPAGLAAWIAEKFRAWTDCDGDPARAVSVDRMLANVTLYWVSGAIGSSFWPYYLRAHRPWPVPAGERVQVPMGYVQFPKEILRPPKSLASSMYADIRRWETAPRGGHFAALEQPEVLAREIRAFFRPLRPRR